MAKLEFNHRTLPQGYQLGDYVIEDLLGQGGFGIAYLAKDIHLHNHVVIKEYFPNEIVSRDGQTVAAFGTSGQDDFERGMQRFVEEGRALARFNHPAVVRILKYFQQNNTAYLVMEFIDGEPLDQYLKRKETLMPEVVEHLAIELLDGLAVVHQHGLIHRDIKPANIMLRPGGKPVLIDFGAAKDALAEKSHSVVVTAGYGALEQYSSKSQLTPATDLYALGGTLYKCLTGETPEEATSRVIDDEHTPLTELRIAKDCSPGLVELIDQCMEIKQADRPVDAQSAKALLAQPKQNLEPENNTVKQNQAITALQGMIEMAGSDGVITQKEIAFIIEKGIGLGLDEQTVTSAILEIAEYKNWIVEQEEPEAAWSVSGYAKDEPTKAPAKQSNSKPLISFLLFLIVALILVITVIGILIITSADEPLIAHSVNPSVTPDTKLAQPQSSNQTPLNAGRYRDNRDGTVTDIKTNLTWMRCSLGQTWNGMTCTSEADNYTWQQAMDRAKQTRFAAKADWRLPTVDELHGLVNCSSGQQRERRVGSDGRQVRVGDNWLDGRCEGSYSRPTIVSEAFPNTPELFYWSASPLANYSSYAWGVNFNDGYGNSSFYRNGSGHVRLVRSGQ